MKVCNICLKPIDGFAVFRKNPYDDWEFCNEHGKMVEGFLINLRNEVQRLKSTMNNNAI